MLSSEFHSDFASWMLSTHEISINGALFTLPLKRDALSALLKETQEFSWEAHEDSSVKFAIKRENKHTFKVHTQCVLSLKTPCIRCLEPTIYNFNLDFCITMLESSELFGTREDPLSYSFDSDHVESDDDKAVGYFSGRNIDLGLILREQVFLEVPDYPHCKSEEAQAHATCKQTEALLNTTASTRENPFVKFWKTN